MPFYKLKTILVTVTVTWSRRNEIFVLRSLGQKL